MPQIITIENDALDLLASKCAIDTYPALDKTNELLPVLQQCVRSVIWTADTSYYLGAVVQPTAGKRNGHRFILIKFDGVGVKSDATTEPTWPTWDNATVTDGNCTWQENGPDYANLWDIRQAAFQAWQLKLDKVSCQNDFQAGDARESRSQIIATLERIRDQYRPIAI